MVDEDNVRMSEYIKQQLGVDYVKGAAFFEFAESEDLLSYKEVVHLPEDALKQKDKSQLVSNSVHGSMSFNWQKY